MIFLIRNLFYNWGDIFLIINYFFIFLIERGVVKFFNVCNQEQKSIEAKLLSEAGSSERKRDNILSSIDKGSFLDRLKESNILDEDEELKETSFQVRDLACFILL